ncbi:MAG: hypothetical protein IPI55_17360 [Flavobacteriales bacterium]|nr:hypothetical protein [Flavobacteriales bacterium]
MNGCDRITFQHITLQRSGALDYARIVNVLTGSTDWHFLNDRFISSTSTSTTGSRGNDLDRRACHWRILLRRIAP